MKLLRFFNYFIKINILVGVIFFMATTSNEKKNSMTNTTSNMVLDLKTMAMKVQEDIENDLYSAKSSYTGSLTGYGADCPLCGGTLSCMPKLDVLHGNVMYQDESYGNVHIVASSSNLSCGTIVRVNNYTSDGEPLYAIVLDRGVGGTNLDLLSESESYASLYVGRRTVNYDVLRKGW